MLFLHLRWVSFRFSQARYYFLYFWSNSSETYPSYLSYAILVVQTALLYSYFRTTIISFVSIFISPKEFWRNIYNKLDTLMELKWELHEASSEMIISSGNNERRGGENNAESRLFLWPQYLYSHLMGVGCK